MRTIREAQLKDKKVLIRVDFNVPRDKEGNITDDTRIKAALPTLQYLLDAGAALVVMSHLGRPKGKVNPEFTLANVAVRLSELLNRPVAFAPDCIGSEPAKMAAALKPGQVLLLENLRFHPEEEKNDPAFAKELAALGDVYVNDAFGTAHRAHASTAGVADYLPAYAGFLMAKEVEYLEKVMQNPESPRMAILGGAKVADKLALIRNLLDKMDIILIGGGMANTFIHAQGYAVGKSLCEYDLVEEAKSIMQLAQEKNRRLILPLDVVTTTELTDEAPANVKELDAVPEDELIADIGPKTVALFREEILKARSIVWNGPVGVFEKKPFMKGTEEIAKAVSDSDAVSLIGGGDSVSAIKKLHLEANISHISTGGGATLEFLEGKLLPGVKVCQ